MPQQLSRLVIIFALAVIGLLVVRHYLVPPTFGEIGHYRAAAIDDNVAIPIKYAGKDACVDCHPDVVEVHTAGRHQTLACEACHGPAAEHIEKAGEVNPVVPRERNFCPRCHGYDPSRPTGFPQIDPITHNPVEPCVTCHVPHAPEPPVTPTSCGACHGEIQRLKAVSHHARLECIDCHEAPPEHLDTPRMFRPARPTSREFCGKCHALDASSAKQIPRVDIGTHGGRYLCWQCHYPHYPEAS